MLPNKISKKGHGLFEHVSIIVPSTMIIIVLAIYTLSMIVVMGPVVITATSLLFAGILAGDFVSISIAVVVIFSILALLLLINHIRFRRVSSR